MGEQIIVVNSVDFDGCLSWAVDWPEGQSGQLKTDHQLIGLLKQTQSQADTTYLMSGSNRQSLKIERLNSGRSNKRSFPILVALAENLGSKCTLDKLLLADIYNKDLSYGETFDSWAGQEQKLPQPLNSHEFEEAKITLLYAQLHHIASKHPNDQISFNFYDDREDITKFLSEYFSKFSQLIPENIKLSINQYGNADPKQPPTVGPQLVGEVIQGTGAIDKNYRKTLQQHKALLFIEHPEAKEALNTNELIQLLKKVPLEQPDPFHRNKLGILKEEVKDFDWNFRQVVYRVATGVLGQKRQISWQDLQAEVLAQLASGPDSSRFRELYQYDQEKFIAYVKAKGQEITADKNFLQKVNEHTLANFVAKTPTGSASSLFAYCFNVHKFLFRKNVAAEVHAVIKQAGFFIKPDAKGKPSHGYNDSNLNKSHGDLKQLLVTKLRDEIIRKAMAKEYYEEAPLQQTVVKRMTHFKQAFEDAGYTDMEKFAADGIRAAGQAITGAPAREQAATRQSSTTFFGRIISALGCRASSDPEPEAPPRRSK